MEKEQAPPTTPSTPTEAKAEAKEDPNGCQAHPEDGPRLLETAFAPVLCPPKLLPIRPYHVQRGQAQDSDDDDEAPPPKEGEEKKNESTTDVYDKRYLAEKKLIGDWGREPVVDEGYDPTKPLELVQKPAAEPAAATAGGRRSPVCKLFSLVIRASPLASRKTLASSKRGQRRKHVCCRRGGT